MKYIAMLMFAVLVSACGGEDKQREDFPDTYQEGERESNERISDEVQSTNDSVPAGDTTSQAR